MPRVVVLLAVALAVLAGGCGSASSTSSSVSASSPSSSPAAEKVVKHYFAAMANGDFPGACGDLAPAVLQGIGAQIAPDAAGRVDPDVKANLDRRTVRAATALEGVSPPPTACAQVLKAVMRDVTVSAVRAATVSVNVHGRTADAQVSGLPDTSTLLAQVLPTTLSLNETAQGWKISQLAQLPRATTGPRVAYP